MLAGAAGQVTQATFHGDDGWAGVTPEGALLRTRDGGQSWERRGAPFGVLPLVALQAVPGLLLAATYDARQGTVSLWRSEDAGEQWTRGGDALVSWPLVAMCADPLTAIVGSAIAVRQPDDSWRWATVGEAGFRRVVGNGATLFALATDALWRSDDLGATWTVEHSALPVAAMIDIALEGLQLRALLRGGQLAYRAIE
jgi:photosystem II stability/assembly factor-like uncharacterized protein